MRFAYFATIGQSFGLAWANRTSGKFGRERVPITDNFSVKSQEGTRFFETLCAAFPFFQTCVRVFWSSVLKTFIHSWDFAFFFLPFHTAQVSCCQCKNAFRVKGLRTKATETSSNKIIFPVKKKHSKLSAHASNKTRINIFKLMFALSSFLVSSHMSFEFFFFFYLWPVLGKVTFKSNALQYCVTP